MVNKSSIYPQGNPQLVQLFAQAPHPSKVLCVALDYAKAKHTALICNGSGDLLQGAFAIDNSPAGLAQLLAQVRACAKSRKIPLAQVFFGGEDEPSFAANFLRGLRQEKFLVVRVNAWEAKQQRSNFQASSDALDLLGIARCCLNRRGVPLQEVPEAYANLRIATRNRDQLVRMRTATSNRIHGYVDRLFPGFLAEDKSGLVPFAQASLDLMTEGLSPQQVGRRSPSALAQWLERRRVPHPQAVAQQLKQLAKATLGPAPAQLPMLQRTLSKLVGLYRNLEESIAMLDREVAAELARTPGALLTSINGFGITLAAGWTAELGPPAQWQAVDHLCSYAGVVPRSKQTGGPDKPPLVGSVQARCNKRLKNVVLQAVLKVRQYGPEDLRQTLRDLDARGAHADFAMAKRLLRLGKNLVRSGTVYRPKALLHEDTPKDQLAAYYQACWDKLVRKWRDHAQLRVVFASDQPLGQWRDMVRELYALELRLPQPRSTSTPQALTP
jgi:transposase